MMRREVYRTKIRFTNFLLLIVIMLLCGVFTMEILGKIQKNRIEENQIQIEERHSVQVDSLQKKTEFLREELRKLHKDCN